MNEEVVNEILEIVEKEIVEKLKDKRPWILFGVDEAHLKDERNATHFYLILVRPNRDGWDSSKMILFCKPGYLINNSIINKNNPLCNAVTIIEGDDFLLKCNVEYITGRPPLPQDEK